MAAAPASAVSDGFEKNRYSLELVDVLLNGPCVFPLDQPTVTVGISGEHTWNLPLAAMGLEKLKTFWPKELERALQDPLITFQFDAQSSTWSAFADFKRPDGNLWRRSQIVSSGVGVRVDLPDDPLQDIIGHFTLQLRDSSMDKPSIFIDRLASLPYVPLAVIAKYLDPLDCVTNFCSLSHVVREKLQFVGVQWRVVKFLVIPVIAHQYSKEITGLLDCMRVAKLLANAGEGWKCLFLGEGRDTSDGVRIKLLFESIRKHLFASQLQTLVLTDGWLPHVIASAKPLAGTLETMLVYHSAGCALSSPICCFWRNVAQLKMPPTTTVTIWSNFDGVSHPETGAKGLSLPNVTSITAPYRGYSPFLPLDGLENLKQLDFVVERSGRGTLARPDYEQISSALEGAFLLNLKVVHLTICPTRLTMMVSALATAAKNVEVLDLHLCRPRRAMDQVEGVEFPVFFVNHLPAAAEHFKFEKLRQLMFDFRYSWVPKGLEGVLDFCLALKRGVSLVEFDCVDCYDLDSQPVSATLKLLTEGGKCVETTRGSMSKTPTQWMVTVRDKSLLSSAQDLVDVDKDPDIP